jgi:hypothetical protein
MALGKHTSDVLPKESLPDGLQRILVKVYECCSTVEKKDKNSSYKHWLTNKHFKYAVAKNALALSMQPVHVCPGFLSMHDLCRNAKYVFSFYPAFLLAFLSSILTVRIQGGEGRLFR